jgi:hypothetical protein
MDLRRSPYIHCYMEPSRLAFSIGWQHFAGILRKLSEFGPDLSGWRVHTSIDSGPKGQGIDPLADVDAAIASYRALGLASDSPGGYVISAEVWREHYGAKSVHYSWGAIGGSDQFWMELDRPYLHPPATLDRFAAIAELILTWQPGRYLWCGDYNYWVKGHSLHHPDRLPAGWFCWVPDRVAPETLPSAWRVGAFLDGTLIVTQRDFFNINDNAQAIARANAVEHEMTEAGLLPRLMDLI